MTVHEAFDAIPGYSHPGEFEALARYASECPGPWVEIGSYCGRSACYLGEAAKEAGTVVFAVDPHRGNPEMAPGMDCHHPEVWGRELGSLSVLVDSVRTAGLEGTVIPVVGPGDAFALTGVRPGFVFIDGDHSYAGCRRDADDWAPLVAPGGMLAMHDTTDTNVGVVYAELLRDGWTLVDRVESLAVLTR